MPQSASMIKRFKEAEAHFKGNPDSNGFTKGEFTFINIETEQKKGDEFVYEIIAFETNGKILGKGGFGTVFIGQNKAGHRYAVKQEAFNEISEQAFLDAKDREREILNKLGKNKGFTIIENQYYAVIRLEEGKELYGQLYSIWKQIKRKQTEKLTIALKAAYDVYLMHTNNIIHGDIKPQNFIMSSNNSKTLGPQITVTSIDHGLSNILKKEKDFIIWKQAGSRGYVAPETYSEGIFSFGSDIYALGRMFKKDIPLDLKICKDMLKDDRLERPSALEVMIALVEELKRQPFEKLDAKAIELISVCETQINTDIQEQNKHLPLAQHKPLHETFKNQKIKEIIEQVENLGIGDLSHLTATEDADQKAIALKAFLLKQLAKQNINGTQQKKVKNLISDINKISRMAKFMSNEDRPLLYSRESSKDHKPKHSWPSITPRHGGGWKRLK